MAALAVDEEWILASHENKDSGVFGEIPVTHLLLRYRRERHFGTPRVGKKRMIRVSHARGDAVGGQVIAFGGLAPGSMI